MLSRKGEGLFAFLQVREIVIPQVVLELQENRPQKVWEAAQNKHGAEQPRGAHKNAQEEGQVRHQIGCDQGSFETLERSEKSIDTA